MKIKTLTWQRNEDKNRNLAEKRRPPTCTRIMIIEGGKCTFQHQWHISGTENTFEQPE